MTRTRARMCVLLSLLVLACFPWTGWSVADRTVPDSGSIIAGSLGDENITLFCEVFNDGGNQQLTTWIRQFPNGSRDTITTDDPNFAFDGEPVPDVPGSIFDTNLTILTLTEDLDRNIIFCGATGMGLDDEAANFTIRIYRPPALRDITMAISVCEDGSRNGTVDLRAAGAAEAFPFPQEFNWTRDDETVDNTTDGGRVTYGYPSVIFNPFNRNESGQYMLSAANYKTNGSLIGSDTGSFNLDVQFGPEFDEGDSSLAVLVEGNITLVCARNVDSNPEATVEWRDPAGIMVSDGGRYTLNNGSEVVSLTITGVIADDNGNWSCTVSVAGSCNNVEERSIMLTVVVAPSQPTNVDVDPFGITATSVRFCWQLPNNLGMPNVSQYRVVVDPPSFLGESEFFTGERFLDVTDLLPGTTHEFTVYARSVSGDIVAESGPSETVNAATDTTVPAPDCIGANRSDGVLTFSFIHTGGLNLTAVSIDYREQSSQEFQELVNIDLNENSLTRESVDMFNFNLTAGLNYIFRVNASNEEGSMVNECPPLIDLQIGIPQTPDTPTGNSPDQGVIELMLRTVASGVVPGGSINFTVEVTKVMSNEMFTVMMQFDGYNDGDTVTLRIGSLVGGQEYTFRARAQNTLGSSEFSQSSEEIEVRSQPPTSTPTVPPATSSPTQPIPSQSPSMTPSTPPPGDEEDDEVNAAAIAGGVIGGFIGLVLIFLIVIIVVYLLLVFKGSGTYKVEGNGNTGVKVEEVEIDIGNDLQGNVNTNNDKQELHYADLETFKPKSPEAVKEELPQPVEEPVQYATIAEAGAQKQQVQEGEGEGGDKSQTSTTLV